MARTLLTVIEAIPLIPTLPLVADSADFAFTPGNAVDGVEFVATGRELILVNNTGASARTVTVKSAPDALGRSGDVTAYSVGAGEFAQLGVRSNPGWRQANGRVWVDMSHAELEIAVIRLPRLT